MDNEYNYLPSLSVVITEYDRDQLENLTQCLDGILKQDYGGDYEIIVLLESEELKQEVENLYGASSVIKIYYIDNEEGGLSGARNEGMRKSDKDVVVFSDSDVVPETGWLQNIGESYRDENTLAVGGKSVPEWIGSRPKYLPDEFLWLVGSTHKGHPSHGSKVRSTFGCNMSFDRKALENINGFSSDLGKGYGYNLQGEEPDAGLRLQKEYESSFYYNENAVVVHKVEEHQCQLKWLTNRAYLQGVTKAIIESNIDDQDLETEESYLKHLILISMPNYFKNSFTGDEKLRSICRLFAVFYFTFLVFLGYSVGLLRNIS